jgi:hypothetical protein
MTRDSPAIEELNGDLKSTGRREGGRGLDDIYGDEVNVNG